MKIVAGDNNAAKKEREEQHVHICNIYIHPKYTKKPTTLHDIALVKLCKDLTFTRYVRPILLPAGKFVVPNSANVIVAGWGHTKEDGVASAILQKVHLRKINLSACKKIYSGITKGQICAGVRKGGKDSCQGDSGGPLWYETNRKPYLIGAVSFGAGCARPNIPGVYTNVAHYRTWIGKIMRNKDNS